MQPLRPQESWPDADADILHLVDLYFRYYNDRPHSIFHEHTFRTSLFAGAISQPVLLAMMGVSARFSVDPEVRARGPAYASRAKKLLHDDFENICLENVQACILVGNICYDDNHADVESLYFALAVRMSQLLQLAVTNESDDAVTREVKIRVWWTCFIIDTWASAGSNLSRQFKMKIKRPRVPMDEGMFYALRKGDPDVDVSRWRPGLWGHMVRSVEIYSQILDFHKHLADADVWDEDSISLTVHDLDAQLGQFEQSLDPTMRFSLDNLKTHIAQGLGGVFVAFNIGLHHYWTLLFYLYLDHRRPITPNGRAYASRCKLHATIICNILRASREFETAEALYNIVGHVAIVSSSVLLHTYLFGEPEELPDAKRGLESNFESLVQLRKYWASIEFMINRLVIFQNNCLRSMNRNTHRFDRWLVKFLLEHGLALEDKEEAMGSLSTDVEISPVYDGLQSERGRFTQGIIMELQNGDHS